MEEIERDEDDEYGGGNESIETQRKAGDGRCLAVGIGDDRSQLVLTGGENDENLDITVEDVERTEVVGGINAGEDEVGKESDSLCNSAAGEESGQGL